jgi:RimJ/RimL family protein N-acetyltransferase
MHISDNAIPHPTALQPATDGHVSTLTYDQVMTDLWLKKKWQDETLQPSYRMAAAWARAAVMYWNHLDHKGGLNRAQPLYLLDWSPESSGLACLMLKALHDELYAHGMADWPLKYLLCSLSRDRPKAIDDPALRPYVQRGWLEPACWRGLTGHPVLIGDSRIPLFGVRNPMIAINWAGISRMTSELYGVHFGLAMRPHVRANIVDAIDLSEPSNLEWRAVEISKESSVTAPLLEHYCAAVISAAIQIPTQALSLIDALADFSGGRYLLITADEGVGTIQQICLGALTPPEITPSVQLAQQASGQPPLRPLVNFHALSWHQQSAGALTGNLEVGTADLAIHMACRGEHFEPVAWQAMQDCIEDAHPADAIMLYRDQALSPMERLIHELRVAATAPEAVAQLLSQLSGALQQSQTILTDRLSWSMRRTLRRVWERNHPAKCSTSTKLHMINIAISLEDWALLRDILDAETPVPLDARDLGFVSAILATSTGSNDEAISHLRHLLHADANDARATQLLHQLQQRQARRIANRWHQADGIKDGDLALEMLDELHIETLLYQYRDPGIAKLAGLPELQSPEQVHCYIESIGQGNAAEYALMHCNHGFIGALGIRCFADIAHIHFWIGVDYRGQGFGACAVKLLIHHLAKCGISHVFTSVYHRNLCSQRILEKTGFKTIAHDAHREDMDYAFMYLALGTSSDQDIKARLAIVYEAIGEPLLHA